MSEVLQLNIRLDANGVAAPAQRAAWQCSELITFFLNVAASADLSKQPEPPAAGINYKFSSPEMTSAERHDLYENWLLGKGFHELARGVHETLEEAVLYLEMFKYRPGQTTVADFQAHVAQVRARAGRLPFPALLAEVKDGMTSPMVFDDDFTSFQKVRNCLEHRAGIVGPPDVDATGRLVLTLPRLKALYVLRDEEIEIGAGSVIDRYEHPEMTEIYVKRDTRVRSYALGERVRFNAPEFHEIAFACHLFASDLATKLPVMPWKAATGPS
ncbi:hypothetical protein [Bradyrhizobium iriomotense]|uniref:hypothetical protein n=1 Tax=Bradyrhizobium iriomotense TaxID=441950 RepID=UPI001B8A263D|nr:hypothetical protein [Bradyrhizobium iriomotense]MBR1130769.1 hypothetical protein [Bradyrhizobium iriomotense]